MRTDPLDELRRLERVADLMDSRFRIPGTRIRIGLDPLIGLIPGIGDSVTLLVSCYLVSRAARMGVPGRVLARMLANVLLDWLAGAVPVVGDVFDIGFRANRRNIDLLRRHLHSIGTARPAPMRDEGRG